MDEATEQIRAHFDELADGEWERLVGSPSARVSLEVHRRFLARFVQSGHRVLEVGAGPGRFTIELAALGASIVVTDISPVQLALNEKQVNAAGWASAVEDRLLLDIRDTGELPDGSFDLVVAYGGPLSYVFDDATRALAGLLRVVRHGGLVVASVMSTLGAWRALLDLVEQEEATFGRAVMDRVLTTGDLRPIQTTGHVCQMYRWSGVQQLVSGAGGRILAASASNWASLGNDDVMEDIAADPTRWAQFVEQEISACSEPGALDGGTHLLFAAASE